MAILSRKFAGIATLIATASTLNVPLNATIPLDRSFVYCTWSVNNGGPANCSIRPVLNATSIDFIRSGTTNDVTIDWYVVEFLTGVTVQRGTVATVPGTGTNITISAVDLTKSWPIIFDSNAGTGYGTDDVVRARLTSSTNLELKPQASDADSVSWQVIQYDACSVQELQVTFTTETQIDTAITSVDPAKTAIFCSMNTDGNIVGGSFPIFYQTSFTNLRGSRFHTAPGFLTSVYVVTFTDSTVCQQKQVSFTSSDTSINTTITAVDVDKTIIVGAGTTEGSAGYCSATTAGTNLAAMFGSSLTNSTTVNSLRAATGSVAGNCGFTAISFITSGPFSQTMMIGDYGP